MAKAKRKASAKPKRKPAASSEWEEATDDAVRFDFQTKGESIRGILTRVADTKQYEGKVYGMTVTTKGPDEGINVYFFGSAELDRKLPGLIGREVDITYLGKEDLDNGQTIKRYKVLHRTVGAKDQD